MHYRGALCKEWMRPRHAGGGPGFRPAATSEGFPVVVATACQAIPVYERWSGPYPYAQFTIAEACFGWNGN